MAQNVQQLLKSHQLRLTDMRVKVLELFLAHSQALSQHDLEQQLGKVDRITLYRTLRSFEEQGLIHKAMDGTDKQKYALCQHNNCSHGAHQDHHAHFHCDNCGKTICIEEIPAPTITPPPGFAIQETHLVIKGKCDTCQSASA